MAGASSAAILDATPHRSEHAGAPLHQQDSPISCRRLLGGDEHLSGYCYLLPLMLDLSIGLDSRAMSPSPWNRCKVTAVLAVAVIL